MADAMALVSARFTNLVARRFPSFGRSATARQVANYRSSGGRKGNTIVGQPVLPFDHAGRSSGERRPVMLFQIPRGDHLVVVAWALAVATYPRFDSHQRFTDRVRAVAVLERRDDR